MTSAIAVLIFTALTRFSDGRRASPARPIRGISEIALGLGLGALLSILAVEALIAFGAYHVIAIEPLDRWHLIVAACLPIALVSAVSEELVFRGVILRQLARTFSPRIALFVSAVLFGLIHLSNPGASLASGAGLIVQAGLLLGSAYLVTGRLWLPVGLHLAWNFMQAAVVGGALSGHQVRAIVTARPIGPAWLSGGSFGIEGALTTTVICGLATIAILVVGRRNVQWRVPALTL